MNDNEKTFDRRMVSDSDCGFFFFEPQLDHYSALPLDHRPGLRQSTAPASASLRMVVLLPKH
jgi:hypothetical protein